jgi:hypothetical protein
MSEVHARNRNVSQFEFYNTALKIYVEVSKLAHSDKVLPKSWRFTHAVPLVDMARSLVYNVNRADQYYPNTAHNVTRRRDYLTLAVADCEQLAIEFGLLPQLGLPVNMNRFERVADMIESEIALLKGARKNVRLVGRQSVEQRIAGLEEQIAELRALS